MEASLEASTMRKVYLRLLPFAILCYILAYLDRINGSFAALTMRGDLGLSAADYGFAVGTFYWGYFLFEVPSNVITAKLGARISIARIMISGGLFAIATAFVWNTTSFAVVRFLLGICEAGFFPGLLLYFTYWFPARHHARIASGLLVGLPIAVAVGGPIATGLMELDGLFGLHSWQLLYIAEGVPTIAVGILFYFLMTNRPEQATFLTPQEKDWLLDRIASERKAKEKVRVYSMLESMFDPRVLLLALNYFGIVAASLGMLFFIPEIIKSMGGLSNMQVGWLAMIPYVCGVFALVGWAHVSDKMNERRWNLLLACILSAGGLALAGLTMGTWWALVGMSLAAIGFYGSNGPFFAMPPMFLSGTALAAGIAWINSLGNLGGFFGPWWIGLMKDSTGGFSSGLYGLALLGLISAVLCWLFLQPPEPTTVHEAA